MQLLLWFQVCFLPLLSLLFSLSLIFFFFSLGLGLQGGGDLSGVGGLDWVLSVRQWVFDGLFLVISRFWFGKKNVYLELGLNLKWIWMFVI